MTKLSRLPFNHDAETLVEALGLSVQILNIENGVYVSLDDAHLLRLTSLLIAHQLREEPFLYYMLLTAIVKGYTDTNKQIENLKLSQVIELIETVLLDCLSSLSKEFNVDVKTLLRKTFFETIVSIQTKICITRFSSPTLIPSMLN